jgi:prefoldin subunit 5
MAMIGDFKAFVEFILKNGTNGILASLAIGLSCLCYRQQKSIADLYEKRIEELKTTSDKIQESIKAAQDIMAAVERLGGKRR